MASLRLLCIGLLVLTSACADLNKLKEDTCGNGVVDDGEDCDGFAQVDHIAGSPTATLSCGAASDQVAVKRCRYTCDATDPATCPDGWSCGSQGVCLFPSGGYTVNTAAISVRYDDWLVFDLTGDNIPDVVGYDDVSLEVRLGNRDGDYQTATVTKTPPHNGPPSFVDIDNNAVVDVIIAIQDGLYVLRTKTDGTFDTLPYTAIDPDTQYPPSTYTGGIIPVVTEMNSTTLFTPFHHFAALLDTGSSFDLTYVPSALDSPNPFISLPTYYPLSSLQRPIAVTNLDVGPGLMEEEFALAFAGADRVWIYGQVVGNLIPTLELRSVVPLAGLTVEKGAQFADVDGNGVVDLLTSTTGDRVAVALGNGDGSFGAAAVDARFNALLDFYDPFGQLTHLPLTLSRWPLASADFDGDGKADYVTAQGVYVTGVAAGLTQTAWRVTEDPWVTALPVDINGDGFMDIALAADPEEGETRLELLLGDGTGTFNSHVIALEGVPFQLVVGDFDGDLVSDLGIASHDLRGMDEDSVDVLFGSRETVPSRAQGMGRFGYIELIRAGAFWSPLQDVPDRNHDLLVFTNTEDDTSGERRIALLNGAPSRRMAAPFSLIDFNGNGAFSPERAIAAPFGPSGDADVIVLSADDNAAASTWFVKGDGSAGFASPVGRSLPSGFGAGDCSAEDALFVLADLDDDGDTELIGFDYAAECDSTGYGNSAQPTLITVDVTEQGVTTTGPVTLPTFTVPYHAVPHDMDGDGAVDLLVTFSGEFDTSVPGQLATGAGVVIYWNAGGTLETTNASSLTLPADVEHVIAAAPIQADDDGEPEVVVFTSTGLLLCELNGRSFAETCTEKEIAEGFRRSDLGGERLFVADVNGDGLDDVLVGDGRNLFVALATSQLDAGAQ